MKMIDYIKTDRGKKYGVAAIMAGFSALFCFMGYEFIRSSSESIFLSQFSASQKVYALSVVPVFLFLIIYIYGFMLSRCGAKKTMISYFVFVFISIIALYYGIKEQLIYAFFLALVFKETYVVVISEMYWSYINSILLKDEARIINGPVAGLGALGSLLGGFLVSRYAGNLTTDSIFLYSSFLLIPAVFIFSFAYNLTGEPKPNEDEEGGKKGHIHISLLFENKTVLILAFIVFTTQLYSTLADLNFTDYIKKTLVDRDIRTSYLGGFWAKVNIISFTMQFVITPIVLKRFDIKYVLVGVPLIHFFLALYSYFSPSLFSVSIVFMIFKAFDYSIYRASKEILYIPFSYDTRYRIKQIVDAFTYRFSKGFVSIILSIFTFYSITFMKFISPILAFCSLIWAFLASKLKTD